MRNEANFLCIAIVMNQNFNDEPEKKGHKKTIDKFSNRLLTPVIPHLMRNPLFMDSGFPLGEPRVTCGNDGIEEFSI